MQLNEIYRWCEGVVPQADENVIPSVSTTLLSKLDILNEGEREWTRVTKCFAKEKKFDCVANNNSYSLTTNIPDFLEMREEGFWHLRSDSSTNTWDRLRPTTMRIIDQKYPTWRVQAASDYVRDYWQDGDYLHTFYTPSTAVTNGFLAYYYATSSQMSATTDYPFTGSVNQTRLEPYHRHIISFYEAKALDMLGYKDDSVRKLSEFYQLAGAAKNDLDSRPDLAQEAHARPRRPNVRWVR
jgi:hypothetical protein